MYYSLAVYVAEVHKYLREGSVEPGLFGLLVKLLTLHLPPHIRVHPSHVVRHKQVDRALRLPVRTRHPDDSRLDVFPYRSNSKLWSFFLVRSTEADGRSLKIILPRHHPAMAFEWAIWYMERNIPHAVVADTSVWPNQLGNDIAVFASLIAEIPGGQRFTISGVEDLMVKISCVLDKVVGVVGEGNTCDLDDFLGTNVALHEDFINLFRDVVPSTRDSGHASKGESPNLQCRAGRLGAAARQASEGGRRQVRSSQAKGRGSLQQGVKLLKGSGGVGGKDVQGCDSQMLPATVSEPRTNTAESVDVVRLPLLKRRRTTLGVGCSAEGLVVQTRCVVVDEDSMKDTPRTGSAEFVKDVRPVLAESGIIGGGPYDRDRVQMELPEPGAEGSQSKAGTVVPASLGGVILAIQKDYLNMIMDGRKTVEGRLDTGAGFSNSRRELGAVS